VQVRLSLKIKIEVQQLVMHIIDKLFIKTCMDIACWPGK